MSPRSHFRHALRTACVALLATGALVVPAALPSSISRAEAAGTVSLTGYGADSCTAPSEAQMRSFWTNTPYSYWGVYIGGSDRGCAQPNLTATWVSHMLAMGWDLLPIWVGPQNPCTPGQASYFSRNTTTAYYQGKAQALAAYTAWKRLSSVSNVPIDYDMEASGYDTTSCRNAAKSFVNGWVRQLHAAPAQKAGVYSSSCAGHLDDYATIAYKPDFIDAADWDYSPSTGGISCVASNHWIYHQRHKQYRGGHNATYNGVTLNIDSRCADGAVYGVSTRISATHSCARTTATAESAAAGLAASEDAPVFWRGSLWQAGGPQDAQLRRADSTTPQRWAPVRVTGLPLLTHDVPASAAVVGRPVVQQDGSLVVPVTEHAAGGRATQTLYTTRDGTRFVRSAVVPLAVAPAAGVSAATTALSRGQVLVLDPDARAATVWRAGHATRFAVRGLPAGAQAVHTAGSDRTLTAVVEAATCHSKVDCAVTPTAYRTVDGGRTWRR